jgi:hypothetical protein
MRTLRIEPENRAEAMARLRQTHGEHLVPLIEVAWKGVTTVFVSGRDRFPVHRMHRGRGMIVIVDDNFLTARGPSGFHLGTLRKLARKANSWSVVVGGPFAAVYEAFAEMASAGEVVLAVETQLEEKRSWIEYLRRHGRRRAGRTPVTPNEARQEAARNSGPEFSGRS